MSARRRRILPPSLAKPARPPSRHPWVVRVVVTVAVLVVVVALAYTIVTGTLFTAPGGS